MGEQKAECVLLSSGLASLGCCSDLEGIQLLCLHCCHRRRCISSSFNSIPALGGSWFILLPEFQGKKKTAKEGIVWNVGSKHRWCWWWQVLFLAWLPKERRFVLQEHLFVCCFLTGWECTGQLQPNIDENMRCAPGFDVCWMVTGGKEHWAQHWSLWLLDCRHWQWDAGAGLKSTLLWLRRSWSAWGYCSGGEQERWRRTVCLRGGWALMLLLG